MTTSRTPRPKPKRSRAGTTRVSSSNAKAEAAPTSSQDGGSEADNDADADADADTDADPAVEIEADGGDGESATDGVGPAELAERAELVSFPSAPRNLPAGPLRDPLARFMSEVRRYPRLSEAEERELGRAVRERGDGEAAKRLVVHNMRLVVAIAQKYRRAWANILDLFQEGSVGLLEAVKRWEPTLGPRFGSYAAYWIRAYVLKFLMTNSRLIHVGNTRAGRKLFFRLERERQKLLASGFEPTPKLLAARLDVDEAELEEVRSHLGSREVPFDPGTAGTNAEGEDAYPLSERVAMAQPSPERRAATAEMSANLHVAMAGFAASLVDERERAIWTEHLAAEEPVSLGEIGVRFGVSKQRMGQIADKLKTRFREQIVAHLGPEIRTDWLSEED